MLPMSRTLSAVHVSSANILLPGIFAPLSVVIMSRTTIFISLPVATGTYSFETACMNISSTHSGAIGFG